MPPVIKNIGSCFTIWLFLGQQLWLVGVVPLLFFIVISFHTAYVSVFVTAHSVGLQNWVVYAFIFLYVIPLLLAMVVGRLRMSVGYAPISEPTPRYPLARSYTKTYISKLIWLSNIAGIVLAPVVVVLVFKRVWLHVVQWL